MASFAVTHRRVRGRLPESTDRSAVLVAVDGAEDTGDETSLSLAYPLALPDGPTLSGGRAATADGCAPTVASDDPLAATLGLDAATPHDWTPDGPRLALRSRTVGMPTLRETATALARQAGATLSDQVQTYDLAPVETPESPSDTHRETTPDGRVVRSNFSPLGLLDRSRIVDPGTVDRDVPRREVLYDLDGWRFQLRSHYVRPLTDRGPRHGETGVARLCEHLTARYEAREGPE